MREFVRPSPRVEHCLLAASMAMLSSTGALAQAKQAPPKQMAPPPAKQAAPPPAQEVALKQVALTEKQIEGVLAGRQGDESDHREAAGERKPDPKILAQLDGVAKKNGFASYDEYNSVVDNVSLVLAGFDPATKKYVGTEAVIKAQIVPGPGR